MDSYRIVVFLHVLLLVYWLGADFGVLICNLVAGKPGMSDDAKRGLRQAGDLIDMGPRTCLVLMVPVGLTLASNFGSPIHGALLAAIWIACLGWLWLVWQVHLQHGSPFGKLVWKVDFALRTLVMAAFVGFGAWCLITGAPIGAHWLAAKMLLFGVIILAGIIIRILLLRPAPATPEAARGAGMLLRNVVFVIWGLVAVIAFLGVVKPF